jgi:uncharacterized protein
MDEPAHRLPRKAVGYWRARGVVQGLGLLVAGFVASAKVAPPFPFLAALVVAVVLAAVLPEWRWRRWRYEVRDDEIDLLHGTLIRKRTLVPIRRVQHVDTETGPLQDSYDVATVTFHTAAGTVAIPALTKREAEDVRLRVAELAWTRDDT